MNTNNVKNYIMNTIQKHKKLKDNYLKTTSINNNTILEILQDYSDIEDFFLVI